MSRTNGVSDHVAQYRTRLRAEGLRPVQIWVPDTRNPELADKLQQQCRALKNDPAEADILAFTEAAAGLVEGWE